MASILDLKLEKALANFFESGKPFLGICLGAQIILETSRENGGTQCLGLLPGTTGLFQFTPSSLLKVPQIGWNQVSFKSPHAVFTGIPEGSEFYFIHSYYPSPSVVEHSLAETTYGDIVFTSILGNRNLIACQFHPEKSGRWGLQLLRNFCKWDGK